MALVVSFKPVAKPPVPHHAQASASSSFSQRKLEIFLWSREDHLLYSNFISFTVFFKHSTSQVKWIWRNLTFYITIANSIPPPRLFIFKLPGASVSKNYWFLKIRICNFEQVIFWLISLNFLGMQTCHVEILKNFFPFTIFACYFFLNSYLWTFLELG